MMSWVASSAVFIVGALSHSGVMKLCVCGCCGVVVVFVSPTMPNSNPPLVVVWLGTAVGHWQCVAIASRRSVVLVLCLVGTILLAAYLLACVVVVAALS